MSTVAIYVPGSRPDRFERAAATGAEVILDLEDSVAPHDKPAARAAVAGWVASHRGPVQVRVNAPGTEALRADLAALPADAELRLPKVTAPVDLGAVAGRRVHVLIESALGVERAYEIARCPEVVTLSLGEADLAAELGIVDDTGFAWIRSRIVVAAAAAGLPAPMMSAYPAIHDEAGLRESCLRGRALGMRGRTAVHPVQVPIIRSVFAPTDDEVAWAAEVLAVVGSGGVGTLADGTMVDEAMARRARALLR